MAILALAEGGAALGRPEWVAAAARGRRPAAGPARRGRAAAPLVAQRGGGCRGRGAGGPRRARRRRCSRCTRPPVSRGGWPPPRDLLDLALDQFADPDGPGTFFDTADDAEALLHRPRDLTDNATPCGSSALASRPAHGIGAGRTTRRGTASTAEAALAYGGHAGRAAPARSPGTGSPPPRRWPGRAAAGRRRRPGRDPAREAAARAAPGTLAPAGTVIVAGRAGRPRASRCWRDRPLVDGAARRLRLPRLRLRPPGHHPRRADGAPSAADLTARRPRAARLPCSAP